MLIEEHMEHFGFFDIVDVMFNKPHYGLSAYKNSNELVETELSEIIHGVDDEYYEDFQKVFIMQ